MERVRVQWEAKRTNQRVVAEWDIVMQCLRTMLAAREPLTVA
jgi:hypothetical protein